MPEYTTGGIQYPIAGDLIKQDSIEAKLARDMMALATTANVAISVEGERAEMAARWKKPNLAEGTNLDSLEGAGKDGGYASLLSATTATMAGLPQDLIDSPAAFNLDVSTLNTGTFHTLRAFRVSGDAMYLRNSSPTTGAGWTPWTKVLQEGDIPEQGPVAGGFKTVPLALTLPASASSTETVAAASLRFPLRFGATVSRWRLHVRNFNYRSATAYAGAVSFTGLWFGQGSHATGAFTATPAKVAGAFTTPGNGDEYVGPWISTPIAANASYLLSTGFTNAAGQANTSSTGGVWRSTTPGNASVTAPTQTLGITAPFNFWIEAETSGATQVVAEVGSSGAAGVGSTLPVLESPLAIYARKIGALPIHYAQPGTTLDVWKDPGHAKWQQWAGLAKPDAVILTLGSNDVYGSDPLATVQANHGVVAALVRERLSPNLYVGTIPPRNTGDETVRRQLNAWLRTLPNGARDIFDFGAAVSADDETILPQYDADGIHTNTAGSTAKANAITRPVVAALLQVTEDPSAPGFYLIGA